MNKHGHNPYDGIAVLIMACALALVIGLSYAVKARIHRLQQTEVVK